jgi:hypothetical protein
MRAPACAVLLVLSAACATTPPSSSYGVLARNAAGAEVYRGPASWTVRATTSGREDVVAIPPLGEVIAMGDKRCRLVRPTEMGGIEVYEATSPERCIETRADKVCFTATTTFVREAESFSVQGCADRNDIFLSRVDGAIPASVGPHAFVERCAPIAAERPNYLRVRNIVVDDNDRPTIGLRFRANGEDFELCFLAREEGQYRAVLDVEDPTPREVVLEGAVEALDDL